MTVLSTKTAYYIIRRTKRSEGEVIEPISYNTYNRTYTPVLEYVYATPYNSQQEVEKRVTILNMLAELEINNEAQVTYSAVKQTETVEELIGEV